MESRSTQWTVETGREPVRLDRFLADQSAASSRERARKLIEDGLVEIDGEPESKPSRLLEGGERISVRVPDTGVPEISPKLRPVRATLEIVHEDDSLIVINKPRGVVVHPGAGTRSPTLVEQVLGHTKLSPIGAPLRPGVVHRIDKDTSGLLVLAKTEKAHQALATLFEKHDITRIYDGLVWGTVAAPSGKIESSLGRHPSNRVRFASVKRGGRRAVTLWKRVAVRGPLSHLRFKLETGRTHQIRVHAAEMGHPLVGDPLYGRRRPPRDLPAGLQSALSRLRGQALHAGILGFVHPVTRQKLHLAAPLPVDMMEVLKSAGS